jgi:carbon starvation protein
MTAMPIMIVVLCLMAIAYRYYSAFLAAKVAVLDDSRKTPAERFNDGQNFHPTNKWVLFGHHFAAISGAGPLIGPVLAAQFGYLPGLLWIVVGVCLAGAVQDFLVLAISIRRGGKSLAHIAYDEVGKVAGWAAIISILFILVIALAGLGRVVVNALGGGVVPLPAGSQVSFDANNQNLGGALSGRIEIPAGAELSWNDGKSRHTFSEPMVLKASSADVAIHGDRVAIALSADAVRIIPGSPWGTFTIACTIPIALFVGLYMYRIRKGRIVEASIIGGMLTLGATVLGGWIAEHEIGQWFDLTGREVVWAMAIYGFVASVLPVWLLLAPRDYLSSFLKIGTIVLLVIGTILANPKMQAPMYNPIFAGGGPIVGSGSAAVPGRIFPFLFITIMCGAISGFHSLVSSGTTPKMIRKESDARTIGYGAMLIEGLVGVVAMIAAATLHPGDYYAMNMDLARAPAFHEKLVQIGADIDHLNVYDDYTKESLRGRSGGAVTLAVGMANIFQQATSRFVDAGGEFVRAMWKYWYHFAIMFEALFILTTIDAGTRIGRFLLQEVFGLVHPKFGRADWWPGTILSSLLIVGGWAYFINADSFAAIWTMFGIANQMLAVIALAIVTVVLVREGKRRYLPVTLLPMLFVATTTTTAAIEMLFGHQITLSTQLAKARPDHPIITSTLVSAGLILAMLLCTYIIVLVSATRILPHTRDTATASSETPATQGNA